MYRILKALFLLFLCYNFRSLLRGIQMANEITVDFEKYYKECTNLEPNQNLFRKYIDHIINSAKPPKDVSKSRYLDVITKFLRENQKPIQEIDRYVISNFLNSNATISVTPSALKHFFGFVKTQTNISFDIRIIKKPDNAPNPEKASGLSFDKVFELRQALKNEYSLLFTYEMVYCYKLSLDQLCECNYQSYDVKQHCFNLTNRTIKVNNKIAELLDQNHQDILKGRKGEGEGKTRNAYQAQFNRMGKLLIPEILLSHDDIKATHELHSMKCPLCQKTRLCESDYWCLVINTKEISQRKRLICKECADKLGLKEHE